jgi:hypothetical protein
VAPRRRRGAECSNGDVGCLLCMGRSMVYEVMRSAGARKSSFLALVTAGLLILTGCSSTAQEGEDAIAARIDKTRERLQFVLSTVDPLSDLTQAIEVNVEEDIRGVAGNELKGESNPTQGFYDLAQSDGEVRASFLLRTAVITGGLSRPVLNYYTCIELRGEQTSAPQELTAKGQRCPAKIVEAFGLDQDQFVDANDLR